MKFESNPMIIKPQPKAAIASLVGKTVGQDYYKSLKKSYKQQNFVYTD